VSVDVAALISRLENEAWRALLVAVLAPDQRARDAAFSDLEGALAKSARERPDLWRVSNDVPLLIEIGMTATFPPLTSDWTDPCRKILFWFVTVKHPWLARLVAVHFAGAKDTARLDAITILAAQRNEEALRTLGELIERHGFPAQMYSRFFWELNDSFEYADLLLPQLVLRAGRYLPHVVDFLNVAHERGKLTLVKLVPACGLVEQRASEVLSVVRECQRPGRGVQWRFDEKYVEASHVFGACLDLLSLIPGAPIELLRESATLADPRLLAIVTTAFLRRGVEPPAAIVWAAAASPLARASLYRALDGFGRLDLFPPEHATFEAFAASHMAGWLAYPTELGYEPEFLELAATLRGMTAEGERRWCLWKFRDADGVAFAGISGPYESEPHVGPLEGGDVFSSFAEWDSATPEQHLQSVLETLRDWRLAT
jgi:hypothetical protein